MEKELFFSGYCRQLDGSRTVTAVTENDILTEADCSFDGCIYAPTCPIADNLRKLQP